MSHTQGKLWVDVHKNIVAEGGGLVAFPGIASGFDQDANARRLVACWNACEGISTNTLEAIRAPIKDISCIPGLVADIDSLRAVNAELLEALRHAVAIIDGAWYCGHELNDIGEQRLAECRAAIASSRKGEHA